MGETRTAVTCPAEHPIHVPGGLEFVDTLEVLGGHATDACVRCRLCGRCFWTVCDMGKWQYVAEREVDPALARKAVVEHDPDALAHLFVANDLPHGPLWDLTGALVEIVRALTPGSNDAGRAQALRNAGAGSRWMEAIRVLEETAQSAFRRALEATFPVDLVLTGHAVREWYEVGDALVLLTHGSELLRLEGRGVTRLELAHPPRLLDRGEERVMLAVGDAAILVLDAAGYASTWDVRGPCKADALDDGWWLLVPDSGEPVRVIEMRRPDGRPRVGFRRSFDGKEAWMPPPRRMGDGWIFSNLVDQDGATQALSLVDTQWKLVAQSGACPRAERRVVPIDATRFLAEVPGAVERWVRRGRVLEIVETIPARSSWWMKDRLVTDSADGIVTARDADGAVLWTWKRATSGATYGVEAADGLLLYDDDHAHWLDRDGRVRQTFDVELPEVRVGLEGTIYLKSLVDLWILSGTETRRLVLDTDVDLESISGDDAVLRSEDGRCWLVDRAGKLVRFEAKDASFPVYATRGGPWVIEGERVRGAFERNARTIAEAIARLAGATTRGLASHQARTASVIVLPDGRVPYLCQSHSPGFVRIDFAGGGGWQLQRWGDGGDVVTKAAGALEGWLSSSSPAKPTLYEIAHSVVELLAQSFDEPWSVSIPGTVDPREMWLRGPNAAETAVGVFADRVNIASVEHVPIATRGDLALRRDAVVAAVRQQKERYARHLAQTEAVLGVARTLAERLSVRLGRECRVIAWGSTSYERGLEPFLRAKDEPDRTLVWLRCKDDGQIEVHGGAWGRAGWTTSGGDVDAMVEPLAEAIERGADLFCVGRLKRGARYRVTRDYEGLKAGEIVTVQGLDDIDNHYGELVFLREDGREVRLGGDYSNPEVGWVGELYLVFEPGDP